MIDAHAKAISVYALCRPALPGLRGRGGASQAEARGGPCGGAEAEGTSDSASQDRLRRLRTRRAADPRRGKCQE